MKRLQLGQRAISSPARSSSCAGRGSPCLVTAIKTCTGRPPMRQQTHGVQCGGLHAPLLFGTGHRMGRGTCKPAAHHPTSYPQSPPVGGGREAGCWWIIFAAMQQKQKTMGIVSSEKSVLLQKMRTPRRRTWLLMLLLLLLRWQQTAAAAIATPKRQAREGDGLYAPIIR
jgi:hypothetical protein